MFASSERINPCSARTSRCSDPRFTVNTFPSNFTDRLAGTGCDSLPLGPSTATALPSTATFTPPGTTMGSLPIRDMARVLLPDVGQDVAAQLLFPALPIRHHPARGGDDRHSHAAENGRNLVLADVHPAARPRHADDAGNHLLVPSAILQVDAEGPLPLVLDETVVLDEALLLQQLGDLHLQPRRRDVDLLVLGAAGVSDPGQQVGDRIAHHECVSSYQLALMTPGTSPLRANSRKQIRHA